MSDRPATRVLSAIVATPWLMTAEYLTVMLDIAARQNPTIEAIEAQLGRPLNNDSNVTVRDGVATIPINGPLFRYGDFFTQISGATTYDQVALDLNAALDDPSIRAILLHIDSPGGEVNGVSELAAMIFAARGRKPIEVYVGGMAASAAYWLASAASKITISDTAMLGSLGAVMGVIDTRERDAKNGVKRYEIVSSQSPKKRVDVAEESGRSEMQKVVDALAEAFILAVATYRGVDRETVINEFGQGGILVGTAVVSVGLADRLGSYESVLAELAARDRSFIGASTIRGALTPTAEGKMDITRESLLANNPELFNALRAEGITEARAEGVAEGRAQCASETATAVVAERERIRSIEAVVLPGYESLVSQLKFEPAQTAASVSLAINEKEREKRGARLAALKTDEEKLDKADATATPGEPSSDDAVAQRVKATAGLGKKKQ